jgi:DNA-binding response OmpR family regulator
MHKTILLVVGDEEIGKRLTARCVEARYDVEPAHDTEQARRLMRILAFEVILVDTTTSRFDAREVAEVVRQAAGSRPVRVVAWLGADVHRLEAPPAGFDACLSHGQSELEIVMALGRHDGPQGCMCPPARRQLAVVRG